MTTLVALRGVSPGAAGGPDHTPINLRAADERHEVSAFAGLNQPLAVAPDEEAIVIPFPLKVGVDSYTGLSTKSGLSRLSDGMWAGSGTSIPSVAFAEWSGGRGVSARLALGMGRMFTGSAPMMDQPAEAWIQSTSGRCAFTVGKYWIPFGGQEWQYESKPGIMAAWTTGAYVATLSVNANTHTHQPNTYLRISRDLGRQSAVGLTFGLGRGLTYDTTHDRAWGVDAASTYKGFRFTGEYVGASRRASDGFGFLFGKVQCETLGIWKPYVSTYMWNDRSGALGRYRSTVYGLCCQLTPTLSVETATAATSQRRVNWLQLHVGWQR